MKYFILLLLSAASLVSGAQNARSVTKSVSDDGKTLQFRYEVVGNDKQISYSNQFDVSGWSKQQKDQLISRLIDSMEAAPSTPSANSKKGDYLHKRIEDNGTTMKVWIEGKRKSNEITYNNSYDVKGKTETEKTAIIEDLLRSLGLIDKKD